MAKKDAPPDRRWKKIRRKYQQPGIDLEYEQVQQGTWVSLTTSDPHGATDPFHAAFDALKPCFTPILGKVLTPNVHVLGVSIKRTDEGVLSVCVMGAVPIKGWDSPVNITLPRHVPEATVLAQIEILMVEAGKYLDGEKAQLTLPFEGKDEPSGDDGKE